MVKVVALVSGGKDSVYAALLAERGGHAVAALATLAPPAAAASPDGRHPVDDLDSFMYQTVCHAAVGALAAASGLPLFRRRTAGAAVHAGLAYRDTPGDEVEDLAALLAFVKERLPEVEAVCCGAVASDYQRTRVERAAARAGLAPLAPMWRRPQAALLRGIAAAGVDAVVVKVAAAGLDPGRHLGARLAGLHAELAGLRRRFGLNVAGEGGEYETLALDCPLFRRGRLVLDEWEPVVVAADALAPVAVLRPLRFHVEPKPGAEGIPAGEVVEVPDAYPAPPAPAGEGGGGVAPGEEALLRELGLEARVGVTRGGALLSVVAEVVPRAGAAPRAPAELPEAASAAALAAALGAVAGALPGLGLGWRDAAFVRLAVPAMPAFAALNGVYSRFLPPADPPPRATVELARFGGGSRQGENGASAPVLVADVAFWAPPAPAAAVLHVQSVSSWAPACIGPYSQAARAAGLAQLAGQVALHPPTLALLAGGAAAQAARCAAACADVAVAVRCDLAAGLLWCVCYASAEGGAPAAAAAEAAVAALLEGRLREEGAAEGGGGEGLRGLDLDEEEEPDDYLRPPAAARRHWAPLLSHVVVPALPRGALVELQPTAAAPEPGDAAPSSSSSSSDDGEGGGGRRGARPKGTWVDRLEERGAAALEGGCEVRCDALFSGGRLCYARCAVGAPPPGAPPGWAAPPLRAAAAQLAAALGWAQLGAPDVAAVRAFLPVGGGVGAAEARAALGGALGGAAVALVPVTAAGATPDCGAALLVELTALRL